MSIDDNALKTLTPETTLLAVLRAVFTCTADYVVYISDGGDIIAITKEQLAFLVERGCADSMIKTLPQLSSRNIIQPINLDSIEYPSEAKALYVETAGAFVGTLETALNPNEPQFPKWWDAPVPFAMISRGALRLNDTALSLFGAGLEKMNVSDLPGRDEFIVRLEGLNGMRFIAFRKLRPGIYTIDDCTDDLNDAQDITWWAAVGQTWVKEIEAQGGTWQRLSAPPEGRTKGFRACEWQGEIQGYIDIQPPKRKTPPAKPKPPEVTPQNDEPIQPEPLTAMRQDDVITDIGPQAMALLAAGQLREHEGYY